MPLSNKQQAFINEYLKCWNATEAARRANYTHPNKQGPRLLVNVGISEEIERRKAELMMSADEALIHIGEIARGDFGPGFFLSETVENVTIPPKDEDEDKEPEEVEIRRIAVDWERVKQYGRLIKSITFTANGPRIELHDRLRALENIGKHHQLFTDKLDITTKGEKIGFTIDDLTQAKQELADWQKDDRDNPAD